MKKDEKRLPPIERYKHFKGFYIERTQEYFLCDLYEISMSDGSIIYKVSLDLNSKHKWVLELHKDENGSWKFQERPKDLPEELESRLSHCIITTCLNKK